MVRSQQATARGTHRADAPADHAALHVPAALEQHALADRLGGALAPRRLDVERLQLELLLCAHRVDACHLDRELLADRRAILQEQSVVVLPGLPRLARRLGVFDRPANEVLAHAICRTSADDFVDAPRLLLLLLLALAAAPALAAALAATAALRTPPRHIAPSCAAERSRAFLPKAFSIKSASVERRASLLAESLRRTSTLSTTLKMRICSTAAPRSSSPRATHEVEPQGAQPLDLCRRRALLLLRSGEAGIVDLSSLAPERASLAFAPADLIRAAACHHGGDADDGRDLLEGVASIHEEAP